jgi:cytochrome c oxidase subunit III
MEIAKTKTQNNFRIHPQQFALYLGIAGIIMMFSALTSAYIVRQAAGNWLEFRLPNLFFTSTAFIILSSMTLQYSYISLKKGAFSMYKLSLSMTFILGLLFVVLQYGAWLQLEEIGVYLTGNPAGSFVYALSGLHAFHVLGGIGALVMALVYAFNLPSKVTEKRLLRLRMTAHYWHFVGVLWIYLLTFFILQK